MGEKPVKAGELVKQKIVKDLVAGTESQRGDNAMSDVEVVTV